MNIEDIYVELERDGNERKVPNEYASYISNVSRKDMSISVEVARLLRSILHVGESNTIVDLGSGFSSYVLRRNWVPLLQPTVTTVDDSRYWLDKTRQFLAENGVVRGKFELLDNFKNHNKDVYDLVFYDLGNIVTRIKELSFVMNLVKLGGVMVLDDLHKSKYKVAVEDEVKKRSLTLVSMKEYTIDSYGRYAGIIMF